MQSSVEKEVKFKKAILYSEETKFTEKTLSRNKICPKLLHSGPLFRFIEYIVVDAYKNLQCAINVQTFLFFCSLNVSYYSINSYLVEVIKIKGKFRNAYLALMHSVQLTGNIEPEHGTYHKVQANLRKCTDSLEPLLLTYTKYGCRIRYRPKFRPGPTGHISMCV